MRETAPRKFLSSPPKAARALTHYLAFHLVLPYGLEYLICLGATWVASIALFHGRLDSPVSAVGVMAAGILARYFFKSRPAPQQPTMTMAMPQLSLADLASLGEALGLSDEHHDGAANTATDKLSGPYL